jgi:endonuclease-3
LTSGDAPDGGAPRPPAALRRKAARADRLLERHSGRPARNRRSDPLAELIGTILSQHTSDTNSHRAFTRLRARFPSWEAVLDAPPGAVVDAIRSGGLGVLKARRIHAVLRRIVGERGAPSLDFLRRWDGRRARAWLRSLEGVGPKTAAIVLMFALGKRAFAVDTHVYRIGRRMGLIPDRLSLEEAHPWMETLIRPGRYRPFHLLLVRHGRELCKARRPRCPLCPVRGLCDFYRATTDRRRARPLTS